MILVKTQGQGVEAEENGKREERNERMKERKGEIIIFESAGGMESLVR